MHYGGANRGEVALSPSHFRTERVQAVTIIPHDKIVVDCVRRVVGGRLAAVDTGTVSRQE